MFSSFMLCAALNALFSFCYVILIIVRWINYVHLFDNLRTVELLDRIIAFSASAIYNDCRNLPRNNRSCMLVGFPSDKGYFFRINLAILAMYDTLVIDYSHIYLLKALIKETTAVRSIILVTNT